MGEINRSGGGADIDRGQCACVAMGEHVHRLVGFLARGGGLDQRQSVAADSGVGGDVLFAEFGGAPISGTRSLCSRSVAHSRHDLIERPFEIDRRGTCCDQRGVSVLKRFIGGVLAQRKADAVSRGGANQGGAANHHGADRMRHFCKRGEASGQKPVRQRCLVDDADRPAIRLEPDGARGFAVNLHRQRS